MRRASSNDFIFKYTLRDIFSSRKNDVGVYGLGSGQKKCRLGHLDRLADFS
jgi:hypothetical protein